MDRSVTVSAERDEIPFGIFPQQATRVQVVNLEIGETPAVLTSPSITLQNLVAELSIGFGVEAPPRPETLHEGIHVFSINCVWRGDGRRPNRRRKEDSSAPGSPLSRFAPARKSTQIISRQVAPGPVGAQHQGGNFKGLFNHRQLALV
jgi:hypothetical protein